MKRKKLLVIGLFLIFVGFCLWGVSSNKEVHEIDEPAGGGSKVWEVSGNFTRGDIMYISMTQGLNWAEMLEPPSPGYKWIQLNVSDPYGGFIIFEVEYVKRPETEPGPPLSPTYVRIEENSSKCLRLLWNEKINFSGGVFIVGEVLASGNYTAKVIDFIPSAGNEYPPSSLQLRRKWLSYSHPYLFLLYLGIAIIILGLLIVILAVKKRKRRFEK